MLLITTHTFFIICYTNIHHLCMLVANLLHEMSKVYDKDLIVSIKISQRETVHNPLLPSFTGMSLIIRKTK